MRRLSRRSMLGCALLFLADRATYATPLIDAVQRGNVEAVADLLSKGADVNAKDNEGWTALLLAVALKNTDVVRFLLDKDADVNVRGNEKSDAEKGYTPLHYAISRYHPEIVRLLLEKGAEVDRRNSIGETPLQRAIVADGRMDIIGLLIDHGADLNAAGPEGLTPLRKGASYGRTDIMSLLVEKGARVKKREDIMRPKDVGGSTLLHWAGWNEDLDFMRLLLEKGASADVKDDRGMTALHWAADSGRINMVRLLLEKGADPNAVVSISHTDFGNTHDTALHLAAAKGHLSIVQVLLEHGADPGLANTAGKTSLQVAEGRGNALLSQALLDATKEKFAPKKHAAEKVVEARKPMVDVDVVPDFKAAPSPDDIAVVIGIEHYQSLPKSDYSKGDAMVVKEYFEALGFAGRNIDFLSDERATRSSIEKSLEAWLPNRVRKGSRVVVYYSGHGAPEPKTGDAYIVPFDGDPNYLEVTGYSLKRLYEKLGQLRASEVVVLLDSCFSGAGGRSVLAKGARPLVLVSAGAALSSNVSVLSATQGAQISTSSPEKGHGVFTYYFLKALKEGNKDLSEIYGYLKPLVEDEAKQLNVQQTPSSNPAAEKLKGRFVLRK